MFHGTTILSVRHNGVVALGGDGQVSLQDAIVKSNANKVRKIYNDRVLLGFAGSVADAMALYEKLEGKLEKYNGNLINATVDLAKDWRSDRVLRRLDAMLAVADAEKSLIVSGTGDVISADDGVIATHDAKPQLIKADTVVLALGAKADQELAKQLKNLVAELYTVGDCNEPRKIPNAVEEGFKAAANL